MVNNPNHCDERGSGLLRGKAGARASAIANAARDAHKKRIAAARDGLGKPALLIGLPDASGKIVVNMTECWNTLSEATVYLPPTGGQVSLVLYLPEDEQLRYGFEIDVANDGEKPLRVEGSPQCYSCYGC